MTTRLCPDSPLVARFVASPNYGERRGYGRPNCLILHHTGMPTGEAALKALTDPACEVSAHYLVWENGSIDQLVAESDRAWHAGVGFWRARRKIDSSSIFATPTVRPATLLAMPRTAVNITGALRSP